MTLIRDIAAAFVVSVLVLMVLSLLRVGKRKTPPPPRPCTWCGRGPAYHHPKTGRCIDLDSDSPLL